MVLVNTNPESVHEAQPRAAGDENGRTASGFPCLTFFERDPLLDPIRSQAFAELLDYVRARRHLSFSGAQ